MRDAPRLPFDVEPPAPRPSRARGRHQGVRAARDAALELVEDHAEQAAPGFAAAAAAFALDYLDEHGPATGETLTNACKAAGIVPHNDKAFGPVYLRLARARRIVKAGRAPRVKGHLTSGANVWALA